MAAFLDTTNKIIEWHEGHATINEVTFGDGNELDLSKQTTFPLVHIIPTSTTFNEGVTGFSYQLIYLDLYSTSKHDKVAVLDKMWEAVAGFNKAASGGSLFDSLVRVSTGNTAEVQYDVRQNRLYGWSLDLTVTTPNGLINCG